MSVETEKLWTGVVKVLILTAGLVIMTITAGVVITTVNDDNTKLPSCGPFEVIVGSGDYIDQTGEWDTYTCKPVTEFTSQEVTP